MATRQTVSSRTHNRVASVPNQSSSHDSRHGNNLASSSTFTVRVPLALSGRNAGEFHWVHNIALDSKGNIYTTEVDTGKRAQKFLYVAPPVR